MSLPECKVTIASATIDAKWRLSRNPIHIALLTGGQDQHYAYGLVKGLASKGIEIDIVGNEDLDCLEFRTYPTLRFFDLRRDQSRNATFFQKALRIVKYYGRLISYAATARPPVFHILWNNRFELIDRTILMIYYKLLRKVIVFTAHNVNAARRDAKDSVLNRWSLRVQYRIADHIFVHTRKMADELQMAFGVPKAKISIIPYGINNAVPRTHLSRSEAKERLGLRCDHRVVLFFGAIAPYKGLDLLVEAFGKLSDTKCCLVIAGLPKGGCAAYLDKIRRAIAVSPAGSRILQRIEYIPDPDVEVYLKAADVMALPYREIFQSGILFLAHSFGLPVVASDVGSFGEEIVEGETGFLCQPDSVDELATTLQHYFDSNLFHELNYRRFAIEESANARHRWADVADITAGIYRDVLERRRGWRP